MTKTLALCLTLLTLAACDTVGPSPGRTGVELSDPWLTTYGDRGGVTVDVGAPDGGRLVVVFNTHETILDTTVTGTVSLRVDVPYTPGWGRPPMPYGDCFTATLTGAADAKACVEARPVHFPTPTQQDR